MDNFSSMFVKINEEGVLTVRLANQETIYSSYMQFIKGGGLFIATTQSYALGEEVNVYLYLMDELEPILVVGKVVWSTPNGAQGALPAGIGFQFVGENASQVQKKLLTYMSAQANTERLTDTM